MDLFWIKTLAQARYQNGHWSLPDPDGIKRHTKRTLQDTVKNLYQELVLAVNTFNENGPQQRQIRLLPVYSDANEPMIGLILMVGALQMRLEREGYQLNVILESLQGFRKIQEKIHVFEPRIDGLGGLSWIMDKKSIMTNEMMIKQLLHDLCSTAYEMEWKG
jgi:hypothetical protein